MSMSQTPSKETPESIQMWSESLLEILGRQTLVGLLEDYRTLQMDPRLSDYDRSVASLRAQALRSALSQNP